MVHELADYLHAHPEHSEQALAPLLCIAIDQAGEAGMARITAMMLQIAAAANPDSAGYVQDVGKLIDRLGTEAEVLRAEHGV